MAMNFFKKKDDVIDLSELQKRGFMVRKKRALEASINNKGYRDFRKDGGRLSDDSSGDVVSPFSGVDSSSESSSSSDTGGFGFLNNLAGSSSLSSSESSYSGSTNSSAYSNLGVSSGSTDVDEKRKRLARRIRMMSEKMEENSNEIFKLQAKIEELERRLNER